MFGLSPYLAQARGKKTDGFVEDFHGAAPQKFWQIIAF
jgi:hypothetical protein